MSTTGAAVLAAVALFAVLAVTHVPLGDYMARVFGSERHLRVERAVYRLMRVDPDAEQRWGVYAVSRARLLRGRRPVPLRPAAPAGRPAAVARAARR